MASITSSNAVFVLAVPGIIFPTQLTGFSADDIFTTEQLQRKETAMGVDGNLTAGRVYMPIEQTISLMADSNALAIFDQWDAAETQIDDVYYANATVTLSAVSRKYQLVKGVLKTISVMPSAGRTLKPRQYSITWQNVTGAPV